MKISVIIPVYQVEKYLCQCIESIQKQSYKNIEMILVDDGAKDSSPDICDDYAGKDNRIKVHHQENGGLSEARNSGIRIATGEYILFLDGDDFYDDGSAIEKLVNRVKHTSAEVINFSYKKYDEVTERTEPYFSNIPDMPDTLKDKEGQVQYLTNNHLYIASACNKMIKKSLLDEEMMFRRGVFSEDIEWCAKLLKKAKTMDFVCENFYCYRQHGMSIRHTITEKKCMDLCENILRCIEITNRSDIQIQKCMYRYIAFQYGTFFLVQAQADLTPKKCIDTLKDYQWILKYHGGNKKLFCLYVGCKVIGYRNLCRIIRLIYNKR